MTEMLRVRVERRLLQQASKVAEEIGTTPGEVVRLLFKQMVKRRAIPFPLQADTPEDEVISSAERRAKLWDEINAQSLQPVKWVECVRKAPGTFSPAVLRDVKAAIKRWLAV